MKVIKLPNGDEEREAYDSQFSFVWVFMSDFSASGARGAPSAIFTNKERAHKWISKNGMCGNLYRLPIDVSLAEYSEPVNGEKPFIAKHQDKSSEKYRSGSCYLGFVPHEHYSTD